MVIRSLLGSIGIQLPTKIPSIKDEQPMMVPRAQLRYLYAFTVLGSLVGGFALLKSIEVLQKRINPNLRQLTESEKEVRRLGLFGLRRIIPRLTSSHKINKHQMAAIESMKKRARESTWRENLSVAALATHEFMVPPNQQNDRLQQKQSQTKSKPF